MKTGCMGFLSICVLIIIVLGLLVGCVPGDGRNSADSPAGFFWGVWHGWMAPISLVVGLVDKDIRVYEVFNRGWSYDFGFYIAIISGFGSISFFRKKKKR